MEIAVVDAEAAVIAIDGAAVAPFALTTWLLGPGMRLDLVVRAPAEGGVAHIVDGAPGQGRIPRPPGRGGHGAAGKTIRPGCRCGPVAFPSPGSRECRHGCHSSSRRPARRCTVVAIDDPLAGPSLGSICVSSNDFWAINDTPWPGRDHAKIPPPLARLERGKSYVCSLKNASKLAHPIHLHGHTFKVLRSDQRTLPVHHADTVLLLPEETIEVAFVADNPGRWMLHCHVIEHQETGMMGYVEVV